MQSNERKGEPPIGRAGICDLFVVLLWGGSIQQARPLLSLLTRPLY